MKKLVSVLTVVAAVGMFASASAHAAETCAAKSAALEKEIKIAQQYGNTYKVDGLKKAWQKSRHTVPTQACWLMLRKT